MAGLDGRHWDQAGRILEEHGNVDTHHQGGAWAVPRARATRHGDHAAMGDQPGGASLSRLLRLSDKSKK